MVKSTILLKMYTYIHIHTHISVCVSVHSCMCMDGKSLHKYIKMCTVVILVA